MVAVNSSVGCAIRALASLVALAGVGAACAVVSGVALPSAAPEWCFTLVWGCGIALATVAVLASTALLALVVCKFATVGDCVDELKTMVADK